MSNENLVPDSNTEVESSGKTFDDVYVEKSPQDEDYFLKKDDLSIDTSSNTKLELAQNKATIDRNTINLAKSGLMQCYFEIGRVIKKVDTQYVNCLKNGNTEDFYAVYGFDNPDQYFSAPEESGGLDIPFSVLRDAKKTYTATEKIFSRFAVPLGDILSIKHHSKLFDIAGVMGKKETTAEEAEDWIHKAKVLARKDLRMELNASKKGEDPTKIEADAPSDNAGVLTVDDCVEFFAFLVGYIRKSPGNAIRKDDILHQVAKFLNRHNVKLGD